MKIQSQNQTYLKIENKIASFEAIPSEKKKKTIT